MKLKRYVLLDNNRIYDREKLDPTSSYDSLMSTIFEAIENGETENLCRQLVATSDDVFDLVRCSAMGGLKEDTFTDDYIADEEGTLHRVLNITTHGTICCDGWAFSKDEATAIYKLIGNDYFCVWKREENK